MLSLLRAFTAVALLALGTTAALAAGHQAQRTVLVTGATGQTGQLVVAELLRLGFSVRGLIRSREDAELVQDVNYFLGDVTEAATLKKPMQDVDAVVSTVGARFPIGSNGFRAVDWEGNKALIDAAKAAGVEHYVLLSAGSAGRDGIPFSWSISPYPWKAKAEAYLRNSGLTYTIVAAGGLTDEPLGQLGMLLAPRSGYETGQISRADLATLLAACVDNPAAQGKTFTAINTTTADLSAWRGRLGELPDDSRR